tara:strand:- start:42 stop:503 length:462 start_codon:yes stop_codon:yes gene_type:complete
MIILTKIKGEGMYKNIRRKLLKLFLVLLLGQSSFLKVAANENNSTIFIYRPSDVMTLTQGVKLSMDGNEFGKLGQKKTMRIETTKGEHVFQTKVGLSLGAPNVTGFSGARKFKATFNLNQDQHYFKIIFKPALLGGKHHVIEISETEYLELSK